MMTSKPSVLVLLFLVELAAPSTAEQIWLRTDQQALSGRQILTNSGIEESAAGRAPGWNPWGQGGYVIDKTVRRTGQASARSTGPDAAWQGGLGQVVTLDQKRPTPILARAWSRAQDVSGSPDLDYSLYLDLVYADGTPLYGQAAAFDTGTHDWQQVSVLVIPTRPVRQLNVYGLFRRHSGTAWFDDFELYEVEGAGTFDFLPAAGEIPAARNIQWQGRKLRIDPQTGAMTLDPQRIGGIVLRDVAGRSRFVLSEWKVEPRGDDFHLSGDVQSLGLHVDAVLKTASDNWQLDLTLRDLTGRDRAVSVYWALPVESAASAPWTWCDDPRRSTSCTDPKTYANTISVGPGANGMASHYPFAAIVNADQGVALGTPITEPRWCRFAFDAPHRVLYAACDLGLSPSTKKSPSSASFRVTLFSFDPQWKFRGALQRYYDLNAAAFARRVQKQGIWMPFTDIATLTDWQDFGFQFQEGAPNPAFDEQHGIYSYPYIEPMSHWLAMPPEIPRTQEAGLKLLADRIEKGDRQAMATRSSVLFGPDGQMAVGFHDTPWCNGALFILNPDPDLPRPADASAILFDIHQSTIRHILDKRISNIEWSPYASGFEIAPGQGRNGSHAARCTRRDGSPAMGLSQTVSLQQSRPRSIVASAWSRSENVCGSPDADYSLYLDLTYTDGTHLFGQNTPFPVGTHDWHQAQVRVTPAKPVQSVSLNLLLRGNHTGTAWFDDVSLHEEGSDRQLVKNASLESQPRDVLLDGLYLDSFEMASTHLNYRRDHFASADLPLIFDRQGRLCQLCHFLVMEMTMTVADQMHQAGKLMFANSVLHLFPWPAGCLDIFGTETNWAPDGTYRPDGDERMLYWRAMCYQRPYLTLQNTRFDKFPHEWVERYFARCCAYGVLPSMFSPVASNEGCYWLNPEFYNRDRDLFRKYIPVVRRIAEAGWHPVTFARTSDEAVWVERFGQGKEAFLTLFNPTPEPRKGRLTVDTPRFLSPGPLTAELLLPRPKPVVPVESAPWSFDYDLQPDQVAVLRLAVK